LVIAHFGFGFGYSKILVVFTGFGFVLTSRQKCEKTCLN